MSTQLDTKPIEAADIGSLVQQIAFLHKEYPARAALEFDSRYQHLAEQGLSISHEMDLLLLNLTGERLYYAAFKAVCSKLGVFDGNVNNKGKPLLEYFVPKTKRERLLVKKAEEFLRKEEYYGYCAEHDASRILVGYGVSIRRAHQFKEILGTGFFVYESEIKGFERIIGKLLFRNVRSYPSDYMDLMNFYKSLIGLDRIEPPFTIARFSDGDFYVLRQGSENLEVVLRSHNVSVEKKYAHLLRDLEIHARLQKELKSYSQPSANGCKLSVTKHFLITGEQTIDFFIPKHDYHRELEESMIVGRENEKNRLAVDDEIESVDGTRRYRQGSNASIDNLMAVASDFIKRFLQPKGISYLVGLVDHDMQPSNYLTNGQVIDLDKVRVGSWIYGAARLLGHPAVIDFEKEAANQGKKMPDLFHKAFEIKMRDLGIDADDVDIDLAYRSFHAHKAWINSFHAFSYECRAGDTRMALAYLDSAMSLLSEREEYKPFMQAYVNAIMQSPHEAFKKLLRKKYSNSISQLIEISR